MYKKTIVSYLTKNNKYTQEQKYLLEAVEKAREEIETAREYFNQVKDPRLIDYAIYREEAAKAKYMYLLSEVKKSGLIVQVNNVIQELIVG
jgi:hypothetical protein